MKLFLVRHGEAMPPTMAPTRPLTETGRQQAQQTGRRLASMGLSIPEIHHSTKLRAAQTAELIALELDPRPAVREVEGLAPEDSAATWIRALQERTNNLLVVSHVPFLPNAAHALLGLDAYGLSFPTAGVIVLGRGSAGTWSRLA